MSESGKIRTVAIVDDERMIRNALKRIVARTLDCLDLAIHEAGDGIEGLSVAQGKDLVITDLQMSGMNGFELVRQLRESETMSKARNRINYVRQKIIMLSGKYLDPEEDIKKMALLESGDLTAYLSKPFDSKELTVLLKRFDSGN
jgi:CheY-like chemotaxis protein